MQAVSRAYHIGGFLLTFFTAFWVVSNYTAYKNPKEIALLKEAQLVALQDLQDVMINNEIEEEYDSFTEDIERNLTEFKYRGSSLLKILGGVVALIGSALLRRKMKLGIHLFIGGVLFGIIGIFYWHGISISGWSMAVGPVIFLAVVGFFIYRKRKSFI